MLIDSNQLVGRTLGTCTLQRLLGRGGMGAVYLAQQERPHRIVAVKVLMPDLLANEELYREFLIRFRREADAIAALDHINIMPIYEYGEEERLAYLVMPYITGGTLREVIRKRGPLPLAETIPIITQAANALDYAHARGIIHRDLKPGNILLHADGRLLLTDFGIAKVIETSPTTEQSIPQQAMPTLTTTGTVIGTPEYFSPEQAAGGPIDQRSDVYSLGIVLYEMLAGRVPFSGLTPVAVALKHAMEQPPPLLQFNPDIPDVVEKVVMKALAKKPEARYPSAGTLAQVLRTASHAFGLRRKDTPEAKEAEKGETEPVLLMDSETILATESPPQAQSAVAELKEAKTPSTFHDEPTEETAAAKISALPSTPETYNAPTVETPARRASPSPASALIEQHSPPVAPPASTPPVWQRQGFPLALAAVSGIVILALLLGGSALLFHWLPAGTPSPSGNASTGQSTQQKHTPAAGSTAHPSASPTAQASAPQPLIAAGKPLYSSALPACDAQRSLWKADSYTHLTCGSGATTLVNSGGHVGGIFLQSLPGGAPIPNDYVLQVQVQENASAQGPLGVFFRKQPGANHQGAFAFLVQPSGYWSGNIYDDTTGQSTPLFQSQGTALNAGSFSTLDIVVQGNQFSLYINGTKQGGISSINYPSGIIGLGADQGASVLFKNLAIYALPGS